MHQHSIGPLGLRDMKAAAKQLRHLLSRHSAKSVDHDLATAIVCGLLPPRPPTSSPAADPVRIPAPLPPPHIATPSPPIVLGEEGLVADVFLRLGNLLRPQKPASLLETVTKSRRPTTKQQLSMTREGALAQTGLFGCAGSGLRETLLTLTTQAMDKDCGVMHFDSTGYGWSASRAMSHAANLTQPERVLFIDLTTPVNGPGSKSAPGTHTFNPFATGTAKDLTQVLLLAMRASAELSPPETQEFFGDRLEAIVSPIMEYLVWGRQARLWGLDLHRLTQGLSFDGLWAACQSPDVPPRIQHRLSELLTSLSATSDPVEARTAYAPWEHAVVDQFLRPASVAYAPIMNSQHDATGWLCPDLNMLDAYSRKLWVFWSLPSAEKAEAWTMLPIRLALAQLAHYLPLQPSLPPGQVQTLLVAHDCAGYATNSLAMPLQQWGESRGLACMWSEQDYPPIKHSSLTEVILHCHNKIFFKMEMPAEEFSEIHKDHHIRPNLVSGPALLNQTAFQAHIVSSSTLYRVDIESPTIEPAEISLFHSVAVRYQGLPPSRGSSTNRCAKILSQQLASPGAAPDKLAWCQETLARMLGFAHWHEACETSKSRNARK